MRGVKPPSKRRARAKRHRATFAEEQARSCHRPEVFRSVSAKTNETFAQDSVPPAVMRGMLRAISALPLLAVLVATPASALPDAPLAPSSTTVPRTGAAAEAEPKAASAPSAASASVVGSAPLTTLQELLRGAQMRIHQGADAVSLHSAQLPVGARGSKIPVQSVGVRKGRIDVLLGSKPKERGVMLQGPHDVVALATTGRLTMVISDEAVSVIAFESDVLVGVKGNFKPLQEGILRRIDRRSGRIEDTTALPAPSASVKSRLHVALDGAVQIPVAVAPTPGAAGYGVTWHRIDGTGSPTTRVFSDAAQVRLDVSEPGNYSARVYALDALGFEGTPCAPLALHVLGLEPGQEKMTANGTIILEQGQRARLWGTQGLEMRYGSSPQFVPAGPSLGLASFRPTTVEYRDPQDPRASAIVMLVPKVLQSQVQMGPKMVHWPEQPVQITVRLWDNGVPLADTAEYVARVTVNGQEIPLQWEHRRGSLEGSLQPQSGPGPWIVRVNVTNARGVEVARDFLEVVEHKRPLRPIPVTKTAAR